MSFRINTNIASLQSQEYLRVTSENQSKTIGRVTSGLRILSSGDDAAGLSIANSFRSDQAVLRQGIRNANDGLSTLQTIDGGINNISKLLDRARTLATQSASGTFIGSRAVLNSEFGSVITEIDRQAQAIGLNAGGEFAKALSVFIGGGKASGGITAIQNGASQVDLSNSTVDAKSLGLKGAQAQGITGTDIGTGSPATSVSSIVNDATNLTSLNAAGFTDFYFRGPGFGDAKRIKVSVNLSGVTTVDNLVTAINNAIAAAGTVVSPEATAFQNANIGATVVTSADGKKSLAFNSSSTAFQVEAGDQMANALLGNVTSAADPTGKSLANTVTGGSATAATATVFDVSGTGTVQVRFQGAGLAGPVDISLPVTAGTTIDQALADLTSLVAVNGSLQAAGITATSATPGGPLVFTSNRGERFEIQASGDLNNLLGLGSFRGSSGAGGTFDYSTITGSGGTFAVSPETLEFSIGGGPTLSLSITPAGATITDAATALNAQFASNPALAAAGLVATDNGTDITITSSNGTNFRIATIGNTNVFGFNAAAATGTADVAEVQAGNTDVNSFNSGGVQQSSIIPFSGIQNGNDDQTVTVSANDSSGAQHSVAIVLRNDSGLRNGGTVDEAISAINTALKQSNDPTLQAIVAVKDKASPSGGEGIRFISTLREFNVAVGTSATGAGLGNQGTVVNSAAAGAGSTADISTQAGAEAAVSALAEAVTRLGDAQAVVGRGQNQFSFAVNLASSQLTNIAAAESRIRDADLAEEAANLTKAQILLQAGISALSQANSAPQQVLSLLRGS
ncbi:MAG TPA: flagellin [Bryobacteraceae bacterium]|nr:flagellin [Bryobacteraceae bacterium]